MKFILTILFSLYIVISANDNTYDECFLLHAKMLYYKNIYCGNKIPPNVVSKIKIAENNLDIVSDQYYINCISLLKQNYNIFTQRRIDKFCLFCC